jgi:hypothetical protein
MANTTNFNWETPDDTDLVKDGAAAIRTLAGAIDTSLVDLKGGTTGQVLSKATGTDMDFTWVTSDDANAIQNAIVDAKGDIIAASAADTPARLAVGTDNQRIVAASGETTGLKYVADTQNTVVDAEGDLLVGDSADTLQRLAIGSNTHVLTVDTSVDGKIKWAAPAGGGKVLQVVQGTTTTATTIATTAFTDTSLSATITPTLATSKILVITTQQAFYQRSLGVGFSAKLLRGATVVYSAGNNGYETDYIELPLSGNILYRRTLFSLNYLDSPATTSATTYKVQAALNDTGNSATSTFQEGSTQSNMILLEIGA